MKTRNYRDLVAWQKAMDLVVEVYQMTKKFPQDERFGLTGQIRKAAVSVPSNIAEGNGRAHRAEYIHMLTYARGSLMELETQLAIAVRLEYSNREEAIPLWELTQDVGRLLNGLIRSLKKTA